MWCSLVLFLTFTSYIRCHEKSFINFGGFLCPREEKGLGKCLKDALNTYIPKLAAGLPKYDIPPCEPLFVRSLSVNQASGPMSINSTFSNVYVRGPSTMRVKNVDVHIKNHEIIAKLHIPELRMKGQYSIKGILLMIPIGGQGDFTSKYRDINATVSITLGRTEKLNAPDALSCEKLDVKFRAGEASMHMENLFGGDKELETSMNQFLSDNWQSVSEELQAPIEEALRDFLKPLADHSFATLNADDILLL